MRIIDAATASPIIETITAIDGGIGTEANGIRAKAPMIPVIDTNAVHAGSAIQTPIEGRIDEIRIAPDPSAIANGMNGNTSMFTNGATTDNEPKETNVIGSVEIVAASVEASDSRTPKDVGIRFNNGEIRSVRTMRPTVAAIES